MWSGDKLVTPILRCALGLMVLIYGSPYAVSESPTRPEYLDRAIVEQEGSHVEVRANSPLPLLQALSALDEKFGWQVNWEQAPGSSRFDTVDDTAPNWRAAHPETKGVTRASGGAFRSMLPKVEDTGSSQEILRVLTKLVEDYNATNNPGKYIVEVSPTGAITIIGNQVTDESNTLRTVRPLMDTPISLARESRSLGDTVSLLLSRLSEATGKKVVLMSYPNNEFRTAMVIVGGKPLSARELLQEALIKSRRPFQYELSFDPDVPAYILNVSVARKVIDDGAGGHVPVPVDRLPRN